jgi:katanin p60 ATPase-containing subunit A1
MVLATTNCPWDLDEAIRRRLEKRIYIPLPDTAARVELFSIYFRTLSVGTEVTPDLLARYTEGYSGFDIHLVCREAAMMPMRKLLERFTPQDLNLMQQNGSLRIASVLLNDLLTAIQNTKPSVSTESLGRYLSWDQEFGSR